MSNMTNEIRKRLCKLCLETSDEQIGILSDEGRLLNIDSTLGQHFRFKFDVNGYSTFAITHLFSYILSLFN